MSEPHKPISLQPAIDGQLSPAERTSLYKRFIETERENILNYHREGAGGLEICEARSAMIDTLIATILQATVNSQEIGDSPIALVAIGGYGRGTLNPGSDIDLLFLLPRASTKLPKNVQELVQSILYPLWDCGFKLGHSCRSIAECIEEARADPQNLTALLDCRLIAGNETLFKDLLVAFEKNCVAKGQDAFFEMRRKDIRSRHQKSSHTVFL